MAQGQVWWGRSLPTGATVGVGARAIIEENGYLDFVPNRRSWADPLSDDFLQWWNETGLPALREYVKQNLISLRSSGDPTGVYSAVSDDGRFKVEAASNRSCGYLYLAAWEQPQ